VILFPDQEGDHKMLWSNRPRYHNRLWVSDGLANKITSFQDDRGKAQDLAIGQS
jgi:hypothetical protein